MPVLKSAASRCLLALVGLFLTVTVSAVQTIERSGDYAADLEQLRALTRDEWLALTLADLGEAWWIVHEATRATRHRESSYTLAVRVDGRVGYIDTKRLSDPSTGMLVPYVLSDLYQSHPRGNFSILVSGEKPPYRPLGAPLRWSGFLWEGLEPPDKLLGAVFEDVAVIRFDEINFSAANGFGASNGAAVAAAPAPAKTEERGPAVATPAATSNTLSSPAPADRAPALAPHDAVALKRPGPVRVPRLDGSAERAAAGDDARLRRVTRFNTLLRRKVAYLEAMLRGRELGRTIALDATVGSLVDVIMQGQSSPQRQVFLRLDIEGAKEIGRIVNASRYPLYKVNGSTRGSHRVLMDLEIRSPDGRTLLKSSIPGEAPRAALVRGQVTQFMHVGQDTTLESLGVLEAVWLPIRG
ncbi:MAG: hypothetical protein AAF458_21710 [Pseudomonadota bacterium]